MPKSKVLSHKNFTIKIARELTNDDEDSKDVKKA